MKNNSVLIVDDQPVVIMGLVSFFTGHKLFKNIYSAFNATEGIAQIRARKKLVQAKEEPSCNQVFDLIILDMSLPDMEITGLIEKILVELPDVKIMILSLDSPLLYFGRLLDLGIRGFLDKSARNEEMMYAVKTVLNNRKYFAGDLLTEYMTNKAQRKEHSLNSLSSREAEILSLLLKGRSVMEICKILHLHKSSIGTYKSRIYKKLNVRNNIELYQLAIMEKLVKH